MRDSRRDPSRLELLSNGTGVIGDSESVVLADGTFMQAACCLLPDGDVLLDPASLTWNNTGAPASWELLSG